MIEFGKTLRSAREAKGYTVSQIAEMTHLKSSAVEGLENEDFSMIAAPIYGRGFVKLYCEAVGLEPKPLVDEFMAIMNGEREIAIKERPVTESSVAPEPPPPPPPTPAPAPVEQDLFRQDPLPPPEPVAPAPPKPISAIPSNPSIPPAPAETEQPAFSRFAAPMRECSTTPPAFQLNPRLIILAVALLALLALLVFGIRALYCATTSDNTAETQLEPDPPTTVETVASKAVETPAVPKEAQKANAAPRTQQNIPSLYID